MQDWLSTQPPTHDWHTLSDNPLLILVGLTGVGKTTTVNAMRDIGVRFRLLPNRRALTDALMIAEMQRRDGDPVVPVHDRGMRFAYTRRYREQHAGGMAHVMAQLWTNLDEPLLFDGLRGVNEIQAAIELFPNARFLVLTAPNGERVLRLIERRDVFDQAPAASSLQTLEETSDSIASEIRDEMSGVIEEAFVTEILGLVEAGAIDVGELRGKLKIVSAESQNYDPVGTLNTLLALAPERTLVGDTVAFSAEKIAQIVKTSWG